MPDVAGRALRAAVDPAVDHDPGADPRADLDEDEVVDAAPAAGGQLAERHHVDVVVHPDGDAAVGEALPHGVAVPTRHDRRRDRPARLELDRAGTPTPMPQSVPATSASATHSSKSPSTRARTASGLGRDVGRLLAVDDDLAREVGERNVGARGAEVGHQQVARVGAEAEQPRRPTARRDTDTVFGEQSVAAERIDALVRTERPRPVACASSARDDSPLARTWSSTATRSFGSMGPAWPLRLRVWEDIFAAIDKTSLDFRQKGL